MQNGAPARIHRSDFVLPTPHWDPHAQRPRIGDVVWMYEQSFPLIVRAQSSEAASPNTCRQRPEHRA
jgi:hypothetical protein